jgi:hypothetical protein
MAVVAIIGTLGFRMGCWTPVVVLLLFVAFAIILAFARGMPTR